MSSLVNSPTNSSPILVTITFSEPVDIGPGTGDLNITNSPADPPISGGPTVYTFNLSPSANGQVTAQYLAGSAVDLAGNTNTDSNTFSINFDTDAPTVTINQASGQSDPTNASPINFTVVFSEPVADFTTGDVMLSGTAGASTATVTGSGTTYNVAVSGMTGSGTVIASLAAGIATDGAGNANLASTSTDNTVTRNLAPQTTLVLSANPTTIAINAISNLSTTGGSGNGTVNFAIVSGPCQVSSDTLTGTDAGTCVVTATKAADSDYQDTTSEPVTVRVLATQAAGNTPGGTVTITFIYPHPLNSGARYWKNINGSWVDWTSRVKISDKTVVLSITDGSEGDTNPNPGEISDPSGPAFNSDPGSTPIPTLSRWGQLILLLLMVMTVSWKMRSKA